MHQNPTHRLIRLSKHTIGLSILTLLVLQISLADAQETNWANGSGGSIGNASNWDSGVPSASTDALFSLGGSYQVDLDSETNIRKLLFTNGAVNFSGEKRVFSSSVTVSGAGFSLVNGGSLVSSGAITLEGQDGIFNIQSGASAEGSIFLMGGNAPGSVSASVSGAGAEFSVDQSIVVGFQNDRTANFTISDGGKVTSGGFSAIGNSTGAVGTVDVTGVGSQWTLTHSSFESGVFLGGAGEGTLNVRSGGVVDASDFISIGTDGGTGNLLVTGDGSRVETESSHIGQVSNGNVSVLDGGNLVTRGTAIVGFEGNGNGTVEVSGQGAAKSQWHTGNLYLGTNSGTTDGGVGQLQIGTDGQVQVGDDAFSSSQSGLSVGDSGSNGKMVIRNGSTVDVEGDTFIGRNTGFSGEVTVSGQGSILRGTGSDVLNVGDDGNGILRVEDRAQVEYQSLRVSRFGDGDGNLIIDDASVAVDGSALIGGFGGTSTVNISNSGGLSAGELSLRGSNTNVTVEGFSSSIFVNSISNFGGVLAIDGGFVIASNTSLTGSSSVVLSGGSFSFGETDLSSFEKISGTNGSLFGSVGIDGYNDINSLTEISAGNLDASFVTYGNRGVIFGSGFSAQSVTNLSNGEIRVGEGEWQVWKPGTSNAGLVNVIGGTFEVEAEFQNRGAPSQSESGTINLIDGTLRATAAIYNGTDAFIGGRGQIISEQIYNRGVMAFSSGNTDVFGDVENNNSGQIVTSGNATLTFFDDVEHNGVEIRTSEGSATVFFGEFSGSGAFTGTGDVFFEGDLRPGNSPDVVSFEGDVFLSSGLMSSFELAGLNRGQFDMLDIDGDLSLGGNLTVDLIDGFNLGHGYEFLIAEADGAVTGQFIGLNEGDLVGTFGGFDLFITYFGGSGNDVGLFTSVPEPSSTAFLGCLLAGSILRRRRKSSVA